MKIILIALLAALLLAGSAARADSIDLTWTSPAGDGSGDTGRANGSELLAEDIAGYKIYIGVKTGVYSASVVVNDGTATAYMLEEMWDNTFYIAMTTIDTNGKEGALSNETVAITGEKPILPPKSPANLTNTVTSVTSTTSQ